MVESWPGNVFEVATQYLRVEADRICIVIMPSWITKESAAAPRGGAGSCSMFSPSLTKMAFRKVRVGDWRV